MSYPVTDFTNLDLWYIYNGILESGGGGGGGMTESEFYAIINGTSPLGTPDSLFETISGGNIPLSNLLYTIYQTLQGSATETTLQSIDSKLTNNATSTLQTTGNTYLNSINGTLQNIELLNLDNATSTLQTAGNNSLTSIDNRLSTIETNTGAQRTPIAFTSSTSGTLTGQYHNISFYNSGTADGTVTPPGSTAVTLPVGVSLNFNAGGNNNRYASGWSWNATGTTFLISGTQ